MLPALDELNQLDQARFVQAIGLLFENAPGFAGRLSTLRPFDSYDDLLSRAEDLAGSLPETGQIELIDGHPRIGADPASVSADSYREQGYDRSPSAGNDDLTGRLARLNDEYERRFGFRCVVFVAGRPRSEIADWMATRLDQRRVAEKNRALADVFAIARDRLAKLTQQKEQR